MIWTNDLFTDMYETATSAVTMENDMLSSLKGIGSIKIFNGDNSMVILTKDMYIPEMKKL